MEGKELTPKEERQLAISLLATNAMASLSKDLFMYGEAYETIVEVVGLMMTEALDCAADLTEESLEPMDKLKDLETVPIYAARIDNVIFKAVRIVEDATESKSDIISIGGNISKIH